MADFNQNQDRSFGWDDIITQDSGEFILLTPGDYEYTVIEVEKSYHDGSEKLPPCNKAIIHIEITGPEGTAKLRENLFLHSKTEGLLSAFFASIGQKKKGEPLKMNWGKVVGSKGFVKIGIREYNGNKYNEIKRFLPAEDRGGKPAAGGWSGGRY